MNVPEGIDSHENRSNVGVDVPGVESFSQIVQEGLFSQLRKHAEVSVFTIHGLCEKFGQEGIDCAGWNKSIFYFC